MMHRVVKRLLSSSLAAVAMLGALVVSVSLPARAEGQDVAQHFSGKSVSFIVPTAPGGPYDVFARLVARSIGKYLPAKPAAIVVQNVPGGGQLVGLRTAMRSRPDGLTIGMLHSRFVQQELMGIDVPDFNLDTVRVIGSPSGGLNRERIVCVRRDIATSWKEVLKLGRRITSGGSAPGSLYTIGPQLVELTGGPIKMVYGYGGTSEVEAAFDRGELDTTNRCVEEYIPRMFPEWIKKKILAPVFWWEARPSEDWLRQLGAPMPPHLFDIVKATEDQKKAFEVGVSFGTVISRVFVMPPGVPNDIYHAWTRAFEATLRDPEFIKGAELAGLEVGLATAKDVERVVRGYRELSPAGRDVIKKLIGKS